MAWTIRRLDQALVGADDHDEVLVVVKRAGHLVEHGEFSVEYRDTPGGEGRQVLLVVDGS